MSRTDEIPPPQKVEITKQLRDAVWLAGRLEEVVCQGAAPVVSMRLASDIVDILGFPSSAAGVLSRALVPIVDGGAGKRQLYRIALMVLYNRDILAVCGDIQKAAAEEANRPHWTVIQVTDVLSSGYTKAGRHLWNVWGLHIWGPLAGRDVMLKATDAYLCGIVRDVSGAKWSKTVAPVDLSLMRLRVFMKGEDIKKIDTKWSSGKTWNADIRKEREGCPKGPCERCRKSRSECPVSPYSVREENEK